jgi:hypothetical protein
MEESLVSSIVTAVGGLLLTSVCLTALTWIAAGRWFTRLWCTQIGLFIILLWLSGRLDLTAKFDAILRGFIQRAARGVARSIRSPLAILLLYLGPPILGGSSAIVIIAFGLYRSAALSESGLWFEAYMATLATWLVTMVLVVIIVAFQVTRNEVEHLPGNGWIGFRAPQLGRRMKRVGDYAVFPVAFLIFCAILVLLYSVLLTDSLSARYFAAVFCAPVFAFGGIAVVLYDVGNRLNTPPLLHPSTVTWARPTGLLLRAFEDDKGDLGNTALASRTAAENAGLMGRELRLGLRDGPMRWLTVVKPGQAFVTSGVPRVALGDDWQLWVTDAMVKAQVVVFMLGKSQGLTWEVQRYAQVGDLNRLRVLVLPQDDVETRQQMFQLLRSMWGSDLAMPILPVINREVVAFWWENGVLKQEAMNFNGWAGVIGRTVFALSAKGSQRPSRTSKN